MSSKPPLEVLATPASSPSFSLHEISDDSADWLDFWRGKPSSEGPHYIDIQSVNYFSDGNFFNATIWFPKDILGVPFKTPTNDTTIAYGMFFDADFSNSTGVEGIDYKVEVRWDNVTESWVREVEEWASNTNSRVLSIDPNYTDVSPEEGYASIYSDMSTLTFPAKYKVIFYAEEIKGKSWIVDHTDWIYIPPPEFSISTLPESVELRAGENRTIEVSVESAEGFEPAVFLYTLDQPLGIDLDIKYDRLQIPSFRVASTPVTISSFQNASPRPYTVHIFANFTFPNEAFVIPALQVKSQNIDEQKSLMIRIDNPITLTDQISDFWQKLGSPINFVYVVAAGLAPFVYVLIKRRLGKKSINNNKVKATKEGVDPPLG